MHRKLAFTLIEVLVVVAIIALLVAILMPSLAKAREEARRAVCAGNTRQMCFALTMYTSEYGYYPGHHLTEGRWYILWPMRLKPFVKDQHKIFWCPTAPEKTYWNGKDHIFSHEAEAEPGELGTFSYGYNDWGVADTWDTDIPNLGLGAHINDPIDGEVKADRVKRPSEMIAIADNNSEDGDGWWDTALDPDKDSEPPGDRHSKGANVVFGDGHTEHIRQDRLIAPEKAVRRMWNNDGKNHCSLWNDLPADLDCDPDE